MNDLISEMDIVLARDKALDLARMDLRKYLETRDPALIVEIPGLKARRFRIRALDVNEAVACSQNEIGTRHFVAVQFGLIAITPGLDGPEAWRPAKEVKSALGKIRPMLSLDEANTLTASIGLTQLYEIGIAIVDRYEQGNGDGGGVLFTLPPQSELVLERNVRQRAELDRKTSTTQT